MLVYGLTSSGMSVTVHYCCGKFDKIDLSPRAVDRCKQDKKISKKKCCDDRQVNFRIRTDQETNVKQATAFSAGIIEHPVVDLFISVASHTPGNLPEHATGPPLHPPLSLFIRNCSIRI